MKAEAQAVIEAACEFVDNKPKDSWDEFWSEQELKYALKQAVEAYRGMADD